MRKGGRDVLAQAMTGVMHRRADPGLPLSIYPTALADYAAGMHLVQGILLALLQRERTGKGQEVFVSLYDSMLAMQMQEAAMRLMRGRDLNWAAMPLAGVFETADGAIVMVGAFKENPLREICRALRLDDLSADPKYANLEQQKAHRAELQALFRETFAGDTTAPVGGAAGGGRRPVCADQDAGGGAGRPPDRAQPDDRRIGADRRGAGTPDRVTDRDVFRAVRNPASPPCGSGSTARRCSRSWTKRSGQWRSPARGG